MSELQQAATKASSGACRNLLGPVATHVTDSDTGSWRVQAPACDQEACIRCAICAKHCPCGVITVTREEALRIDMRFCKGCGICAQVCPKQCIQMVDNSEVVVK